jgi:hypothetical protein
MAESFVLVDIRAKLGQRRDFKLVRINNGMFRTAHRAVRTISVNGFPDTFGVLSVPTPSGKPLGVFVGIEAKDPGEVQSDDQVIAQGIIESLGGFYFVAYSGDEAVAKLGDVRREAIGRLQQS